MERDVSSMINNLLYVFKYFYNLCIVYWDVKFENLLVSLKYCYKVSLVWIIIGYLCIVGFVFFFIGKRNENDCGFFVMS